MPSMSSRCASTQGSLCITAARTSRERQMASGPTSGARANVVSAPAVGIAPAVARWASASPALNARNANRVAGATMMAVHVRDASRPMCHVRMTAQAQMAAAGERQAIAAARPARLPPNRASAAPSGDRTAVASAASASPVAAASDARPVLVATILRRHFSTSHSFMWLSAMAASFHPGPHDRLTRLAVAPSLSCGCLPWFHSAVACMSAQFKETVRCRWRRIICTGQSEMHALVPVRWFQSWGRSSVSST